MPTNKIWMAHQEKDCITLPQIFLTQKDAADHSHVESSALPIFVMEKTWCPGLHPEARLLWSHHRVILYLRGNTGTSFIGWKKQQWHPSLCETLSGWQKVFSLQQVFGRVIYFTELPFSQKFNIFYLWIYFHRVCANQKILCLDLRTFGYICFQRLNIIGLKDGLPLD